MRCEPRPDDFANRRERLRGLSDAELHARFWELVERIVAPLVEEARTHTSPAIERAVLQRMGFGSQDASVLVKRMAERGLLGRGAGRLVLELASRHGLSPQQAGSALLEGRCWEELEA